MNIEQLRYFVGKVCTVFTHPINRDFKTESPQSYPQQLYVYFVGYVESVSETGIMLTQALTGLKTFLFLNHVIGISEEEVLDENDPKHAEEIENFKKQQVVKEQKKSQSPYVDPDSLNDLVQKMKK
jgi:hypothetical protein